MKKMLCRIGFWFLRKGGWNLEVLDLLVSMPPVEIRLIEKARQYTSAAEQFSAPGTSGEYKRHVVYAKLLKDFPGLSKRQVSMAIEIGLG